MRSFLPAVIVSGLLHYVAIMGGFLGIILLLGKPIHPEYGLLTWFYLSFAISGAVMSAVKGLSYRKLISVIGASLALFMFFGTVRSGVIFKSDRPRRAYQRMVHPDFLIFWCGVPLSLAGCAAGELFFPQDMRKKDDTVEQTSQQS